VAEPFFGYAPWASSETEEELDDIVRLGN